MFCSNCGTKLKDGVAFCSNCGTRVGAAQAQNFASAGGSYAAPGDAREYEAARAVKSAGNVVSEAFHNMSERLNEATGGSGEVNLKFGDFFADIFKHHSQEESDELFICGTAKTTPDIRSVSTAWPKPWLWSRVFLVLAIVFAAFAIMFALFQNPNLLPSIIFFGALVMPFTLLIFFFETNVARNITIMETIKMFLFGGVASILLTHILTVIFPGSGVGDFLPAMATGILEEIAKVAIIVYFMIRLTGGGGRDYVLTGMLIGAAVGAGFGAFESAGYAFVYGGTYDSMLTNIIVRAVLAIGMHTVWAAVEGAALALCDDGRGFTWNQLANAKFLIFLGICIVLHGLWDMTIPVLDHPIIAGQVGIKYPILIVAIWVCVLVLLNRGLSQINQIANTPAGAPGYGAAAAGAAPYAARTAYPAAPVPGAGTAQQAAPGAGARPYQPAAQPPAQPAQYPQGQYPQGQHPRQAPQGTQPGQHFRRQ